jgi:hypothetical protein
MKSVSDLNVVSVILFLSNAAVPLIPLEREVEIEFEVNLLPTVSRPVCLGVGLPSGTHEQVFVFCLDDCGFFYVGHPL